MNEKVYLILEDGKVFAGKRFGAFGDVTAQLVFSTGMNGYVEALTDSGLYGCAVLCTFPITGCYGMIPEDAERREPVLSAYIVREFCDTPSNFRSQGTVSEYLEQKGIIGVYGVDTRAIMRYIREHGTMNVRISSSEEYDIEEIKAFKPEDALKTVSCQEAEFYPAENEKYKISMLDLGAKKSLIGQLNKRGCTVTVYPYYTPAWVLTASHPDGIVLSNGITSDDEKLITEISKLNSAGIPILAVDAGHIMLAKASGLRITAMKCGHHGGNQPVRRLSDGRIFITSQGHGETVELDNSDTADVTYVNLNDGSCEGLKYKCSKAISVQFHPEANSGPHDTMYIFDEFIDMLEKEKNNAAE